MSDIPLSQEEQQAAAQHNAKERLNVMSDEEKVAFFHEEITAAVSKVDRLEDVYAAIADALSANLFLGTFTQTEIDLTNTTYALREIKDLIQQYQNVGSNDLPELILSKAEVHYNLPYYLTTELKRIIQNELNEVTKARVEAALNKINSFSVPPTAHTLDKLLQLLSKAEQDNLLESEHVLLKIKQAVEDIKSRIIQALAERPTVNFSEEKAAFNEDFMLKKLAERLPATPDKPLPPLDFFQKSLVDFAQIAIRNERARRQR